MFFGVLVGLAIGLAYCTYSYLATGGFLTHARHDYQDVKEGLSRARGAIKRSWAGSKPWEYAWRAYIVAYVPWWAAQIPIYSQRWQIITGYWLVVATLFCFIILDYTLLTDYKRDLTGMIEMNKTLLDVLENLHRENQFLKRELRGQPSLFTPRISLN